MWTWQDSLVGKALAETLTIYIQSIGPCGTSLNSLELFSDLHTQDMAQMFACTLARTHTLN